MVARQGVETTIGMNNIKERRLTQLQLASQPGLYVGQCVPFYLCPRSVMLYLIQELMTLSLRIRVVRGPSCICMLI